jgi:hypothetical protein
MVFAMRRVKITIASLSVLLIVLVAAVALLATVRHGSYPSEVADRLTHLGPAASMTDLSGTAQLRDAFNRDAGTPRLVLLFSPT